MLAPFKSLHNSLKWKVVLLKQVSFFTSNDIVAIYGMLFSENISIITPLCWEFVNFLYMEMVELRESLHKLKIASDHERGW